MPDVILFWNDVALEANRISFTNGKMEQPGPTLSSRALAIVHLAMYDAYVAIVPPAGPPYIPPVPPPPPIATKEAAVTAAAYFTLKALYPSQKDFFDAKLSESGGILDPGHNFGHEVAKRILDDRKNDPDASADGFIPSLGRGCHKVDPDNPGQGFHAPFYGAKSKGFAITARHELQPPPFDNPEYISALRQVRGSGIAPELIGTLPPGFAQRTIDQTVIGIFWAYDGPAGIGTPPRQYNQIIRRLAIAKGNTEAENARLFALVNVAMADAGILAWDQKYIHNFWRPVVGIREHDKSMGLATIARNNVDNNCDSSWLPLGSPATNSLNQQFIARQQTYPMYPHNQTVIGRAKNFTPNFPAYPSGHATFGAAAFHIARLFYGPDPGGINNGGVASGDRRNDHLFDGLDFVSDEFNEINQDNRGTVRPRHVRNFLRNNGSSGGLWQMIEENGRSRVYLGVHWVFDAFVVRNNGNMDLRRGIDATHVGFGGVPLGLTIAEDIFNDGMRRSPVPPRP